MAVIPADAGTQLLTWNVSGWEARNINDASDCSNAEAGSPRSRG